jgi:hypothetical protein
MQGRRAMVHTLHDARQKRALTQPRRCVQVDQAALNERFFTEIRSRGSAAAFDVIAHHLGTALT